MSDQILNCPPPPPHTHPLKKYIHTYKKKYGEPITDLKDQMDRWLEHYSELYLPETVVTDATLNSTNPLPIIDELDAEPTSLTRP